MDIIQTFSLTDETERLSQIEELLSAASQHDPSPALFPIENGAICWMAIEGEALCAVLSLLSAEDNLFECRAVTHPAFRQRGIFRLLLSKALKTLEKNDPEADLCFPVSPLQTDGISVLKRLEAEYWYSEYMMECPLPASCPLPLSDTLELRFESAEIDGGWICRARSSNLLTGSCLLLPYGQSAYLCKVEVPEALRGQGFGTALIQNLLSILYRKHVPSVVLQVSEDNAAAMALYKKTGFQIIETLSYYLY